MVKNMNFIDPEKNESANEDDEPQENIIEEDEGMEIAENDQDDESVEEDPEYSLLDKQLDDLNSVLDMLEQKNDSIQSQLRVLLENSREIRQNLAKERESESSEPTNTDS